MIKDLKMRRPAAVGDAPEGRGVAVGEGSEDAGDRWRCYQLGIVGDPMMSEMRMRALCR